MRGWQLFATVAWAWLVLAVGNASSQTAAPPSEQAAAPADSGGELSSAAWRMTLREFDEWASVQKIYDANQIQEIRSKLIDKASRLSGNELHDFMYDVNERLDVLMSAEAKQARLWLLQTLSVASDSFTKKILDKAPDIATLTASQLEEQLDLFNARRGTLLKNQADFEKTRDSQVKALKAENQRQAAASERPRTPANNGGYSGYVPSTPRRQYVTPSRPVYYHGFGW